MPATLDCKNPSVVIVGHWNAAILNEPGWIARHLLDVPEGQKVNIPAIVVGNQVGPGQVVPERQIWMFDDYGFCCSGQRLEFYTRNIDKPAPLLETASRIIALLPHTPVKAVGINFNLHLGEEVETIAPLFETQENFDTVGSTNSQERNDSIDIFVDKLLKIDDGMSQATVLNLNRRTDFGSADINFNYHIPQTDSNLIVKLLAHDPLSHWREHMLGVAHSCYLIDSIQPAYF